MSSGTFVDRIDPFAKRSLKKKSKRSQGSSRYRNSQDVELQQLPPLKGKQLCVPRVLIQFSPVTPSKSSPQSSLGLF